MKRYLVSIEVDVQEGEPRSEFDDALRLAYSVIAGQLWGDIYPEDATLDVEEVEAEDDEDGDVEEHGRARPSEPGRPDMRSPEAAASLEEGGRDDD